MEDKLIKQEIIIDIREQDLRSEYVFILATEQDHDITKSPPDQTVPLVALVYKYYSRIDEYTLIFRYAGVRLL